jgi:hypothetical protein
VDHCNNSPDDIPLDLGFFSAFEDLSLQFTGTMDLTESESFTSPLRLPLSLLDWLRTFLAGFHPFHASLMATPPPQFHTSTLRDRDWTSHSAVLTDMGPDSAEAAMCMRSTLGCGTLDGPSLVSPVSLLLKRRGSARGAGLQRQRAPGRPGWPASVRLRLMQTYDMYIPVI